MKLREFVAGRVLSQLLRSNLIICRKCLFRLSSGTSVIHHRPYTLTHSNASPSPPPPPPQSGFARLSNRRLISLRGPDAAHYLQGVITANISPSRRTSGFYAAFLNAQGRVLNDVFIYPDSTISEHGWLIDVDAAEADNLYKHVKRYKLRAKFDVRLVDASEMSVWSIWQGKDSRGDHEDGTVWTAHKMGDGLASGSKDIGCADLRAPGMGRRVVLPGERKPEAAEDMEESSVDTYRIRRYLKGVGEGQREILKEAALPQESNIDFMGGIDYRKGCYVGQELTIRTHHTGVIRKRILPVMIYAEDREIPKTLEYRPDEELESPSAEARISRFKKTKRSAGKWLAGTGNVGLGLCRVEIMTPSLVQGETGYQEGDEFKLEWNDAQGVSKIVKVKAFMPSWHLTK